MDGARDDRRPGVCGLALAVGDGDDLGLRVLALASLSLSACQSPAEGAEAGETAGSSGASESGSGGDTPTTTASTGDSDDGGETCPVCTGDEACIAGACVAVGRGEVERGCSVLGDPGGRGQCLYPWPSDLWTVADATSATGRRLAHDPELLPKNGKQQAFAAAEMTNTLDGFSPNAQIRFAFAQAVIDPSAGGAPERNPSPHVSRRPLRLRR